MSFSDKEPNRGKISRGISKSIFKDVCRLLSIYLLDACLLFPFVHITHFHNPGTCQDSISGNVYVRGEKEREFLNESTVLNTIWVWEDADHRRVL